MFLLLPEARQDMEHGSWLAKIMHSAKLSHDMAFDCILVRRGFKSTTQKTQRRGQQLALTRNASFLASRNISKFLAESGGPREK